jgi:hypothetical protein
MRVADTLMLALLYMNNCFWQETGSMPHQCAWYRESVENTLTLATIWIQWIRTSVKLHNILVKGNQRAERHMD